MNENTNQKDIYSLSKEENEIELEVTSAFKKVEAQINRDLAKELKCKQYEIADIVYKKILAHRNISKTSFPMILAVMIS